MVQLSSTDNTKLEFRKLNDPNDTPLISAYKHFFRYASPNLFIWGPLAPAHDALIARSTLARIQIALGIVLIGGSIRRFPKYIPTWRRRFTRTTSFLGGATLLVTALREVSYAQNPNSNPLYVEIQLARELSLLDPANEGKINRGSYWFGPNNFMPMNNEQYWRMVYSMEVNEIMADQYLASPLITTFKKLLNDNFTNNEENLTDRISQISNSQTSQQQQHHRSLDNHKQPPFPLFDKPQPGKTLQYWTVHNPFDALQLQEYKQFYAYVFPRLQFDLNDE